MSNITMTTMTTETNSIDAVLAIIRAQLENNANQTSVFIINPTANTSNQNTSDRPRENLHSTIASTLASANRLSTSVPQPIPSTSRGIAGEGDRQINVTEGSQQSSDGDTNVLSEDESTDDPLIRAYDKWFCPTNAPASDPRRHDPNFVPFHDYSRYLLYTSELKLSVPTFSFFKGLGGKKRVSTLPNLHIPNSANRDMFDEILRHYNITYDSDVDIYEMGKRSSWYFPPNIHYVTDPRFYRGEKRSVGKPAQEEDWPAWKEVKKIFEWPEKAYNKFVRNYNNHPRKAFRGRGKKMTDDRRDMDDGSTGPVYEMGREWTENNRPDLLSQ